MTVHLGTVVKVGGSLFDLPDLATRLRHWLQNDECPRPIVFLAGLGPLGDAVREWQNRFAWSDEHSHAMCLALLDVSAQALAAVLPEMLVGDDLNRIVKEPAASAFILKPCQWLLNDEPTAAGIPLPRSWDATTDSIAARLAGATSASELILLKSAALPSTSNDQETMLREWSSAGLVDPHFPQASATIPVVRMINLRSR